MTQPDEDLVNTDNGPRDVDPEQNISQDPEVDYSEEEL